MRLTKREILVFRENRIANCKETSLQVRNNWVPTQVLTHTAVLLWATYFTFVSLGFLTCNWTNHASSVTCIIWRSSVSGKIVPTLLLPQYLLQHAGFRASVQTLMTDWLTDWLIYLFIIYLASAHCIGQNFLMENQLQTHISLPHPQVQTQLCSSFWKRGGKALNGSSIQTIGWAGMQSASGMSRIRVSGSARLPSYFLIFELLGVRSCSDSFSYAAALRFNTLFHHWRPKLFFDASYKQRKQRKTLVN